MLGGVKTVTFVVMGCHMSSKIDKKPKGVGTNLKDAADAESKVIILIEIQEGKEEMN